MSDSLLSEQLVWQYWTRKVLLKKKQLQGQRLSSHVSQSYLLYKQVAENTPASSIILTKGSKQASHSNNLF